LGGERSKDSHEVTGDGFDQQGLGIFKVLTVLKQRQQQVDAGFGEKEELAGKGKEDRVIKVGSHSTFEKLKNPSFSMTLATEVDRMWRAVSKEKLDHNIAHKELYGRSKLGDVVTSKSSSYSFVCGLVNGIRISMLKSSVVGQEHLELRPEDFDKFTKCEFVLDGNRRCKFKDYAPAVFRQMRRMFGVDDEAYLNSVGQREGLTEISTEDTGSKSGQKFLITHDGRYFMKTTTASDARFFMKVLPHYYRHMKDYKNSLLCRFMGLHRLKPSKMHLLVMANIFDTERVVHQRFDLKGSTVGRSVSEAESKKATVIFKDLDFLAEGKRLSLGAERKKIFVAQIMADCLFLQSLGVMDYSLLLGVHHRQGGLHEVDVNSIMATQKKAAMDLRPETTGEMSEEVSNSVRELQAFQNQNKKKRLVRTGSLKRTEPDVTHTSDFQVHDGGWASEQVVPREIHVTGGDIYFVGIIDYLQYYNTRKRAETILKSFTNKLSGISAVDPKLYAKRFSNFLTSITD
jgi:hypothetical protein